MSFFVSESIKEIIDEDTFIDNVTSEDNRKRSIELIFKKESNKIRFDIQEIIFDKSSSIRLSFLCYDRHIDTIYLKKIDSTFLKIGTTQMKLQDYSINSIIEDSKDTYIISLLCHIGW